MTEFVRKSEGCRCCFLPEISRRKLPDGHCCYVMCALRETSSVQKHIFVPLIVNDSDRCKGTRALESETECPVTNTFPRFPTSCRSLCSEWIDRCIVGGVDREAAVDRSNGTVDK